MTISLVSWFNIDVIINWNKKRYILEVFKGKKKKGVEKIERFLTNKDVA